MQKKAATILRMNKKNFQDEELSDELFLQARQTTAIKNASIFSAQCFKQNQDYYFNYEPRFNGAFSKSNLSRIRDGAS